MARATPNPISKHVNYPDQIMIGTENSVTSPLLNTENSSNNHDSSIVPWPVNEPNTNGEVKRERQTSSLKFKERPRSQSNADGLTISVDDINGQNGFKASGKNEKLLNPSFVHRPSVSAKRKPVKPILSPQQKREIEEVFQLFDTDGSGTMEVTELKVVLWAMGFQPESGDVEMMISEFFNIPMEQITEYSMTQADFLKLMTEKLSTRDMSETLSITFQLFDQEKKGFIERKDIKRVCREIGEYVSDNDLELMMAHIDKSGDGSVSVDEWITVMADF
jgi:Ca2+-binding EF-hand superfamily protein